MLFIIGSFRSSVAVLATLVFTALVSPAGVSPRG